MGHRVIFVPQPRDPVRALSCTGDYVPGGENLLFVQRADYYLPDFNVWSVVAQNAHNPYGFGTFIERNPSDKGPSWLEIHEPVVLGVARGGSGGATVGGGT